jgi:TonB family protein
MSKSGLLCAALISASAFADATAPVAITRVPAEFPADAGVASGTVVLRIVVGVDGAPREPEVLESAGPAFDEAAIRAVLLWRFQPALRDGRPVESRIRVPFELASPGPDAGVALDTGAPATELDAGSPEPAPIAIAALAVDAGVEKVLEVTVLGRARPPRIGAAEYTLDATRFVSVPQPQGALGIIKLAPSILLTNEGGEGHAEQIFLRGFDAREAQDLELSVDGVPVNEAGNLHGNGYADTHFIIPEVVESVRLLEGPFDPRQGNFAVAGSADFHLGLADPGVQLKLGYGSFDSKRLFAAWRPNGFSTGTFAAVELYDTAGYGQNRDGRRASAIAQYEGGSSALLYRITAQAYLASFHTAGVLRDDDYESGRVGFYDSYDVTLNSALRQGETASRYSIAGSLETHSNRFTLSNQLFAIYRPLRLIEDFTGYLLDTVEPQQTVHPQRGDLIDDNLSEVTLGARGFARTSATFLGRAQELEVGYFARHDIVSSLQQRVEIATGHPYHTDVDLQSDLDDLGVYADVNFRPLTWLALRGGVRGDLFLYRVNNLCAVQSVEHPSSSNPPGDASCLTQQNFGAYRDPNQTVTASTAALMPRATLIAGPWAGVQLSASAGTGVRSIDPVYVTQDEQAPFARILAFEVGAQLDRHFAWFDLRASTSVFDTKVDKDLIFSQTAGRATLAGPTTRLGWAGVMRVAARYLNLNVNASWVHATFDDTGLLIPYVPEVVLRGDAAAHYPVGWERLRLLGGLPEVLLGTGVTYVAPRPLPFDTRSDPIFTLDGNLQLGWPFARIGLAVTNLLNAQYRLGEYNFASDFHSQSEPTLVPVRMFTAGPPRALMLTLTLVYGGAR